jgi:glycosyltransferase involved in cell wall biosynthesis
MSSESAPFTDYPLDRVPFVSFVIPTLNAGNSLRSCLTSIFQQEYPREKYEVIICDGGSSDQTRVIATQFGCRVIDNPKRLAEPGVSLGISLSRGEVSFVLAYDNVLRGSDWIRKMVRPFMVHHDVLAAFTHVINGPLDSPIARYLNALHADPFDWFVFERGNGCDPRLMRASYPSIDHGDHLIFQFPLQRFPFLALAQGFGIRKMVKRVKATEYDDILPIIDLVRSNSRFAYVPKAGIYHHQHLRGLADFSRKFSKTVCRDMKVSSYGYNARQAHMSTRRRIRQAIWLLYGFSFLIPLVDSVRGVARERDRSWLYHPIATIGLASIIIASALRRLTWKND